MLRPLLTGVLLASCAIGPELAGDEIYDCGPPAGAKAGMSITWRHDRDDIREETWACVAEGPDGVVIEERETRAAGTTVTAKRFSTDGRLVEAWRGPAGGAATWLKIVPALTIEDYRAAAEGMSGKLRADAEQSARTMRSRETVVTPAGTFDCVVAKTDVSVLFLTSTLTSWHAVQPLPLSRLVKVECGDSLAGSRQDLLVAFAWTGAVPTLSTPQAR